MLSDIDYEEMVIVILPGSFCVVACMQIIATVASYLNIQLQSL